MREASTQYVWWQDADSIFPSPWQRLKQFLPNANSSITISGDYYCYINSGHIMMRRDEWTARLWQQTWDIMPWPRPSSFHEQSALIYYLSGEPATCRYNAMQCCDRSRPHVRIDRHVDYRPYGSLNTYHTDYSPERTVVVHFPRNVRGVTKPREVLMRDYAASFSAQLSLNSTQRNQTNATHGMRRMINK